MATDPIKRCVADITNRAEGMSKEDGALLENRIRGMVKRFIESRDVTDVNEALKKALDQLAKEELLAGRIEKRNTYLNFIARQKTVSYIKQQFSDNPLRGLEALLVGVQSVRRGSRMSAAAAQDSLTRRYVGVLTARLQEAGHFEALSSGALDRDISDYMFLRDKEGSDISRYSSQVREIGDIIANVNEMARRDANDAGAAIGDLQGYITRQSHNMMKVRSAGYDQWKADIMGKLDLERTRKDLDVRDGETDDDALDRYLKNVFEAIQSGDHMRADKVTTQFKGTVNIARSISHSRKLHFKSGGDWHDYNGKYGSGSLRETVLWSLHQSANHTGLMKTFGPNPEDNIRAVINLLKDSIKDDPERKNKFMNAFESGGSLRRAYDNVSGLASIPVSAGGAKWSAMARAIETMSSLGAATISALSDLPIFATQWQRQYGSYFEGLAVGIGDLLTTPPVGANYSRQEAAAMLGMMSDAVVGGIAARFSGQQEIPGKVANGVNTFFKFNGLHWWTDTLKQAFAFGLSKQLHMRRNGSFAELPDEVREVAGFFNIDESDWDILRASEAFEYRGDELFSTQNIANVSDDVVAKAIQSEIDRIRAKGADNADAQINAAIRRKRDETQTRWESYFLDRTEHAVITPDRKTNTILNQGMRPGTVGGELMRFFMQFKAFPITVLQKGLGAQMFTKGVEFDDLNKMASLQQGLKTEYQGVVTMVFAMTAFGYASMSAKDALKGKKPRDITDPKTVMAALTQGGSLGLIGDLMFNPVPSRAGGGLVGFGGPVFGDLVKSYDVYQSVLNGENPSATAVRQAWSLVPGNNLFYAKPVLDYLFVNDLYEAISPGYLRRTERRLEREQGVEYLWKPSESTAGLLP